MASWVHPGMLWELTHVTGDSSVPSLKGHGTWFPMKGKKANVAPIFRKSQERFPVNDRLVSPSMPHGGLETRKEEKVNRSCQHRFTNGKSCAACVPNFSCDEVSDIAEAVGVVYFEFSKALATVFHSFLLTKLVT